MEAIAMAGKRRPIEEFPTPTISEFEEKYVKKALATEYPHKPWLAQRDAALVVFEFLYKLRVSEAVGRIYPRNMKERSTANHIDVCRGVTIDDFKPITVGRTKTLQVKHRVLKRGRKKLLCVSCGKSASGVFCRFCGSKLDPSKVDYRIPQVWEYSSVRLDHPLMKYLAQWLKFLFEQGAPKHTKVFDITSVRAWQIMKELGIMNHTLRHWRATQLADTMDPFELKEALHRATIPWEYVHRSAGRRLAKEKKADKAWA